MGGLAVELSFEAAELSANAAPHREGAAVAAMLARMRTRGVDGARIVRARAGVVSIALGHAATWVSDEDQGLVSPIAGHGWISAFDGRIDNRLDLMRELRLAPDAGDPIVAHALFVERGERAIAAMRGDFSVVAFSIERGLLVAAPDRVGGCPLYVSLGGQGLPRDEPARVRIASEKQALFADRDAPRVNRAALASALAEDYAERDETLYEGIHAIPPGTALLVDRSGARRMTYWTLDPERRIDVRDPREASALFESELTAAVRCRMRSRAGVACTVSGGLDSTTVAAIAARVADHDGAAPPILVTVRYADAETDEIRFSRALARHLGLDLHVCDAPRGPGSFSPSSDAESLFDPYVDLLYRMRSPVVEAGRRAISLGFGGDELQPITGFEVDQCVGEGDVAGAARWADFPSARSLRRLASVSARRLAGRSRTPGGAALPSFLTPEARAMCDDARAERAARLFRGKPWAPATRAAYELMIEGQAGPLGLTYGAHAAARLGVAFLQPYLDVRVIELLFALPLGVRADPHGQKPLLRAMGARGLVPPAIHTRRERADFSPFFGRVLRENRAEYAALFEGGRLESIGLVSVGAAVRALDEASSDPGAVRGALTLVTYEGWLASVMRLRPTAAPSIAWEPVFTPDARRNDAFDGMNASVEACTVW